MKQNYILSRKIIVFTGVDKTGKTNISKELSNILNIPRFKDPLESRFINSPQDFENLFYFSQLYLVGLLKQTNYSIILDRGWPCEYAYGKILRKEFFDENKFWEVDNKFSELKPYIIFLKRKEYNKRDEHIPKRFFKDLEKRYEEYILKTKCNVLKVDVDDECLEREIKEIIAFIVK